MKIALAHRRRLEEIPSSEIRGMLVEVRRANSPRWELATVLSSATAPQQVRKRGGRGGERSAGSAATGVATKGAGAAASGAPRASRPRTANASASDAHAAMTKCFRVNLASRPGESGGRTTVIVVSSEHIRQRDSSWEWTTVSAENCTRHDAAVRAPSVGSERAPPADHARVTCAVNVLPYLYGAGPRLVSGRACVTVAPLPRARTHELPRSICCIALRATPPPARTHAYTASLRRPTASLTTDARTFMVNRYTIAIRLEWLSEAWRTTATRKLPPIPFASTDIALLESTTIEHNGRAAWPVDHLVV